MKQIHGIESFYDQFAILYHHFGFRITFELDILLIAQDIHDAPV